MGTSFFSRLFFLGLLCSVGGWACGAGFSLQDQSILSVGSAFAGAATNGDDASNTWENPALLSWLPEQRPEVVIGASLVAVHYQFRDTASVGPSAPLLSPYQEHFAGRWHVEKLIPHLLLAVPVTDFVTAGLAVVVPYGLSTVYDPQWGGRFITQQSEIKTTDVAPSVSVRISPNVSIAVGADREYFFSRLTQDVNLSPHIAQNLLSNSAIQSYAKSYDRLCAQEAVLSQLPFVGAFVPFACSQPLWGTVSNSGRSTAWGWRLGMVYQPTAWTRVGIDYHSSIHHTLVGEVTFGAANDPMGEVIRQQSPDVGADSLRNRTSRLQLVTPDVWHVGVAQKITNQWDAMADLSYTGSRSVMRSLQIRDSSGAVLQELDLQWRNTVMLSVGGQYHQSASKVWRAGLVFDQGVSPDAQHRTPRLPDNNKVGLAVGMSYHWTPHSDISLAGLVLRVNTASIETPSTPLQLLTTGVVRGTMKTYVFVLGAQYVYRF